MPSDRFLLIKAWSYILWADVEHVLGQLLIAEISGRLPVVFWSTHCIQDGTVQTNGFELYFEPISGYTIFDLAKPEYTFFPPIWDSDSFLVDDQNKDTWAYRNLGDIICSKANVVIGDVYYSIYEIIPFVKKDHPVYGMTAEQAYHYLFSKYIRVKHDIEIQVQDYYGKWIKNDHPVLAVHVRRADKDIVFDTRNAYKKRNNYWKKIYRNYKKARSSKFDRLRRFLLRGKIKNPNELYHKEIRKYIDKYNIKRIFLLTDCEETVNEYKALYGSKLLYTDSKRLKDGETASQMENPMIKKARGVELLKDTYIAARCDFFIGNDYSHLTHAVMRIKDWGGKSVSLLYWLHKKFKYPVNVLLIIKNPDANFFKRVFNRLTAFINKHFKVIKFRKVEGEKDGK